MSSNLKIKSCSVAHSGIISVLHGACFEEAWSEPAVQQTLSTPGIVAYLAVENDEPFAFIVGRVAIDEAEVLTIGVTSSWRRKGIARLLLETFLEEVKIRGAKHAYLEVADDNNSARSLYALAQFEEVGRRPDYYRRQEQRVDALVLKKAL
jgi:[ribosomal protein S18]-alanine N-acetyltransferase